MTIRVLSVSVCFAAVNALVSAADPMVDFNREIRPILSDRCYKCHGPDDKERQGGLRLDTHDGAVKPAESGKAAIVSAKVAESELVARITHASPDERMPPASSGKTLSPKEIELLKKWVEQGGEYKQHWSFVTPTRPTVPNVQHAAAVRNDLDRFVIARLEKEGLAPSPGADKTTLIRRVTLDLTGLPPTPAEVDAFVKDASPDAYEKLVGRLLKSPRYGEHFARYWLDAVRYADTHGLHFDNERSLWPYRDWVVRAFNNNLPFDQFTVEQVAGDLLPSATLDQKIASGFNRCNVSTSEGGSINDEVLMRYAVDRTEAVGTVWLGLTLGCCVCHSHKFDPISQKEFYSLYAFFNSAADAAMDGNQLGPPPVMKLTTPEFTAQLKSYDDQLTGLRKQIADAVAKLEYTDTATAPGNEPREHVWIDDAAPPGAKLEGNTPWEFVTKDKHPVFSGEKATRRSAAELSQHFFTGANPGLKVGEGDKLFAYVYMDIVEPPKEIMLQWNDGSWEHRAFWGQNVIPWGMEGTPARVRIGELPELGKWVRLEVEAAKVGLAPGSTINGWAFTQHGGTVYWDKAGIVTRTPQDGGGFESLAAWESFERGQSKSSLPKPVLDAIKLEVAKRSPEQTKLIRDHFLEYIYPKTKSQFDSLHTQIADLTKKRTDLENAVPTTMVMADMPAPRDTFVMIRGQYDRRGDKVAAGVPAVFPPLPEGVPTNRLGLAKWLVQPSHPLTARVVVNRFWQQYFGTGLVKTSEDFGAQGVPPSHPDLLDWLATQFIASGWDVKALQKLIVMSGTYQQSSHVTPVHLQRDPANELLTRGPRFRLDAEVIRDSALFVSGLLIEKQGGRSVRPYQPEGIWEAVAFQGSNTQNFRADSGEGLYRRSMYTFWKRTAPPPSLTTFDAPNRETCSVRRPRTNTPLQALVLLNDKQYVEAARKLAERMLLESGPALPDRLHFAFRTVTGRLPSAEETAILTRIYDSQLKSFESDKDAASKLLSVGDAKRHDSLDATQLAATTMVASLLLNLDETVTKE